MAVSRTRIAVCLICAGILGIAYPHAELAWKCRDGFTASEGCVWARAYFPMSRWVEPIIVTPIALAIVLGGLAITMRKR